MRKKEKSEIEILNFPRENILAILYTTTLTTEFRYHAERRKV